MRKQEARDAALRKIEAVIATNQVFRSGFDSGLKVGIDYAVDEMVRQLEEYGLFHVSFEIIKDVAEKMKAE